MGLRIKGETAREIAGLARVMREKSLKVVTTRKNLIDTCGTGGGGLKTFSVSTGAAFVAAGAGANVAKHGNRGMSSGSGSFDTLEALGVDIGAGPEAVGRCLDEHGLGFMFAQAFHPAMKHVGPVRRELGVRTVFNLLGPLTNPAGARRQVIGVPRPELTLLLAEALALLGAERVMVVHGEPGMGELSTLGLTHVADLREGTVRTYTIEPESVGIERSSPEAVIGGAAEENAATLVRLFQGETGPRRDLLLLNAAAGIMVADLAGDLREGLDLAAKSIDSGAALGKLEAVQAYSPHGS